MTFTDLFRGLLRRIVYSAVGPAGPEGAFARVMAVAVAGGGLEEVADREDARELMARCLDPDREPGPLSYRGTDRLDATRRERLGIGLRMVREELARRGMGADDAADPDLWIGTLVPVPGPGRRPVVEVVRRGFGDADPDFAEVVYTYVGGGGVHSCFLYRDAAGRWTLDLVRALLAVGTMQQALGEVQTPGCSSESEAFEV